LKAKNNRIVFTNGCFDLLHVGHIRYLQQAAALGDCLILGLNSDISVKILKGEQRPILPQVDRAYVLSALSVIDYVVIFDEETPLKLIQKISPHILVKGGDYVAEEVVGYDHVVSQRGQVQILPFVEGKSTTAIVDRIQDKS